MQEKGSAASKTPIAAAFERRRASERARIMAAMLELSGEIGYNRATVRRVLERSGGHLGQFYLRFRNREDCFAAAHEAEVERLYSALVAAGHEQPSWREGLRAALSELFGFAVERPQIARAILSEVYVAGGAAQVKHEEVLERLASAIDGACRETESRHSPPPLTAPFMVGAIERSVRARLAAGDPERLWAALPELMHLMVAPYLGEEAAREELRRPASGGGGRRHR